MSYRIHAADPEFVEIQFGTVAEVDAALGFEHSEHQADRPCLVLNDAGNQEAWVFVAGSFAGGDEAWEKFTERLRSAISRSEEA